MHWRRKWQPTPVFLPGESQGWGSLVAFHLWGRIESDMTEAIQQQQQPQVQRLKRLGGCAKESLIIHGRLHGKGQVEVRSLCHSPGK